mmetsp:Transcript_18437/g.20662  ORF Transcript_18437/g.20662 Transcript_18437/m.20662 type:complete len:472 (-) Transcript_18437:195-1610(-)
MRFNSFYVHAFVTVAAVICCFLLAVMNIFLSFTLDSHTISDTYLESLMGVPVKQESSKDVKQERDEGGAIIQDTFSKGTYFQSKDRYTCTLQPRAAGNGRRYSTSNIGNLATLVVFQSNGANQLQNFMAHHTRVVGTEYVVIVDHQSERTLADLETAALLEKYNLLGSDIWQCDGSFNYKGKMWSEVIHQYTHSSEFVFPLDVDELITVKVKKGIQAAGTWDQYEDEILSWNANDFSNSLDALPDSEKPFKFEQGDVLPADCGDPYDKWQYYVGQKLHGVAINKTSVYPTTTISQYVEGPLQKVKYAGRSMHKKARCIGKAFMRGKDFNQTDKGNHIGATHKYSFRDVEDGCLKKNITTHIPGKGEKTETVGLPGKGQTSGLFLLHLNALNFEEFLMHALRGASDMNFNKFPNPNPECKDIQTSVHYCQLWNRVMATEFNPRKMKAWYREKICRPIVAYKTPFPINHLFIS